MIGVEGEPAALRAPKTSAEARPKASARRGGAFRNRWVLIGLAVLVLSALGWAGARYLKARAEAQRLKKLVATTVLKGEFVVKTRAAAAVMPLRKVTVMPIIGGRMESI